MAIDELVKQLNLIKMDDDKWLPLSEEEKEVQDEPNPQWKPTGKSLDAQNKLFHASACVCESRGDNTCKGRNAKKKEDVMLLGPMFLPNLETARKAIHESEKPGWKKYYDKK